jgi:hypothetical protein
MVRQRSPAGWIRFGGLQQAGRLRLAVGWLPGRRSISGLLFGAHLFDELFELLNPGAQIPKLLFMFVRRCGLRSDA